VSATKLLSEAMLTMRPAAVPAWLAEDWQARRVPVRFVSNMSAHSSSGMVSVGMRLIFAAQLIRMSTLQNTGDSPRATVPVNRAALITCDAQCLAPRRSISARFPQPVRGGARTQRRRLRHRPGRGLECGQSGGASDDNRSLALQTEDRFRHCCEFSIAMLSPLSLRPRNTCAMWRS